MNVTVVFQHPFEKKEQVLKDISSKVALKTFEEIDWAALNEQITLKKKDTLHPFYFYEVSSSVNGQDYLLTLSPLWSTIEQITEEKLLFLVRYEYPHPTKSEQRLDYILQECSYAFSQEALMAFLKHDEAFLNRYFVIPRMKAIRLQSQSQRVFKWLALGLIIGIGGFFLKEKIWIRQDDTQLQTDAPKSYVNPSHTTVMVEKVGIQEKEVGDFPTPMVSSRDRSEEDARAAGAQITQEYTSSINDGMSDRATPAPSVMLDTKAWKKRIDRGDFVPDQVKEAYERALAFDASTLQVARDKPTNKEAQQAIVRYYEDEVADLLKENHAHIRIGKAYNAPLQSDDEIVRVTAMVCAFDTKGHNLGNIQAPLDIAYDFVKYTSEPEVWYVSDLSQDIPYDYELNRNK